MNESEEEETAEEVYGIWSSSEYDCNIVETNSFEKAYVAGYFSRKINK